MQSLMVVALFDIVIVPYPNGVTTTAESDLISQLYKGVDLDRSPLVEGLKFV